MLSEIFHNILSYGHIESIEALGGGGALGGMCRIVNPIPNARAFFELLIHPFAIRLKWA